MRKLIKNKMGFTLVELVVVFALTGLMMSSAAVVLSRFSQTFVQANALSQEQGVASTIMQSICSELGSAKASGAEFPMESGIAATEEIRMKIQADGSAWFIDTNDYAVKMYVEDGYLRYTYYNVPAEEDTDGNPDGLVTTGLGEGAYHGCKIEGLTITRMAGGTEGKNNCLTVTLKVGNARLGTDHVYTMTRTFSCYNILESEINV